MEVTRLVPVCSVRSVWMHRAELDGLQIAVNYDIDWTYMHFVEDK